MFTSWFPLDISTAPVYVLSNTIQVWCRNVLKTLPAYANLHSNKKIFTVKPTLNYRLLEQIVSKNISDKLKTYPIRAISAVILCRIFCLEVY
jgi:hypothetical protein